MATIDDFTVDDAWNSPVMIGDILSPGIYFLFLRKTLQYIGESSIIARRMGDHKLAQQIQFDDWRFIIELTNFDLSIQDQREEAEKQLIWKLKPLLNKQHVLTPLDKDGRRMHTSMQTHRMLAVIEKGLNTPSKPEPTYTGDESFTRRRL